MCSTLTRGRSNEETAPLNPHIYNCSSPPRSQGVDVKNVLTTTAVIEVGAGIVFLARPSLAATHMFGSSLDTPVESTVARIVGVALLALGVACWLARHDGQSQAARALVRTMVLYNAAAFTVLVYAGVSLGLSGSGLWPAAAALLHAAMAVWCVMSLLKSRT